VEGDNLYRVADTYAAQGDGKKFTYPAPNHFWNPWGNWLISSGPVTPDNPALETLVPVYGCPSDSRTLINEQVPTGVGSSYWKGMALTAYVGVAGISGAYSGKKEGIIYVQSKTKIADITDGTSNTLLVGERPPSTDLEYGWWFAGAGYDNSGVGDVVLGAREYNYAAAIGCGGARAKVGLQPGTIINPCDQSHFWSMHPGGANFLMGDGSARFLVYSVDNILPALATRNGGEVISFADL
jgi:prepilin-type processing-associated H-X9-DG protein